MRQKLFWLPLILAVAACESSTNPSTGMTDTRLTIPFTSANAERAEAQWRQCVQFRSESFCARNLPGGRPASIAGPPPAETGELLQRENDP